MGKSVERIIDLDYNEIIALRVIELDSDLKKIFSEEVKITFPMLYSLAKENQLNTSQKELIRGLFDHVILTKKELVSQYLRLSETGIVKIEPVSVPTAKIVEPIKKETKLPRRYGKEKILADIVKQGGTSTPLQKAMLKVNDLKNIYVNLSARGIKDMIGGTNLLSDTDCREIVSVIVIAERKLEEILKRKK